MDILKPPIVCIDGRCYRQNPIQLPTEWVDDERERDFDEMYDIDGDVAEESCDFLDQLKQTDKGYSYTMDVPSAFFGHVIGRQGETKKRIEQETQSQLVIPGRSQKDDDRIVIRGENKAGIISAKTRIELLISTARQKMPFTHLLTVPLNATKTQGKLMEFTEDVLRDCRGDEGLDETVFQKPAKLHLTVGVLVLMTHKEVAHAEQLLQECKREIIAPILQDRFLLVDIKGLEYMNDDPGKVDVLYGEIKVRDGSNKLQLICDSIVDRFTSAGLMQKEYDRVKIHATLMNTIFRREPDAEGGVGAVGKSRGRTGEGRATTERESFDARRILNYFGDYSFGDYLIDSIHLSQRGSYGADGYYHPVGIISIP